MISARCECGTETTVGEEAVNTAFACPSCGRTIRLVCAEQLAEGAGAGDFDARLTIAAGPARVGECILLGGVLDIEIGKLAGKHLLLEAQLVSRNHCKLVRVDFGPSRWKIVDNKSTNGLFVNGERISEKELAGGDEVNIGGYRLMYSVGGAAAAEEEPIVLEEEAEEAPVVAAVAAPPVKKKKARRTAYAPPGSGASPGFISDSDPSWVGKLRNGVNLLLLGICINLLSSGTDFVGGRTVLLLMGISATLSNLLGAWMLTMREPEVEESTGHGILRLALRIISSITASGMLSLVAANLLANPALGLGGILVLAAIPQFFLLLLFMRQLALRLPNETLATQCLVVMIGLPASVMGVAIGFIYTMVTHSPVFGIFGVCGGALAILTFGIWYIVLLIWLGRSLVR